MTRLRRIGMRSGVIGFVCFATMTAHADTWPMKHRDAQHTGRATFSIPANRQNAQLFGFPAWQTPTPGSPGDGNIDSGALVFFDGAGPGGVDVLVGGYHWPKGVMAVDRQTGRRLWSGNPSGGETIGSSTPAFSGNGATVYVLNDATNSAAYPNGHPLMAFATTSGPQTFRHNGGDAFPNHLSAHAPTIATDGRVFLHSWVDRPYAGADLGTSLTQVWAAQTGIDMGLSDPSLYPDGGTLRVISGGRSGRVTCHHGATGALLWSVNVPTIDATPTIDPANGNIYVPAGSGDVYLVGLSRLGQPLWANVAAQVFDHEPGVTSPQRAQAAGCLSHDGATFYFQTNSSEGSGRLYAVHTASGALKWSYDTASSGWEMISSSPIVTPNGVVIIGNNNNGKYFALRDDGAQATQLAVLHMAPGAPARAAPALSSDGVLYLPVRATWSAGNGSGESPTNQVANLFAAYDLRADPSVILPPPGRLMATALHNAVRLRWTAIPDPLGQFAHYAVYRATAPFSSVAGMTPIATVSPLSANQYTDNTATNGTSYYYAVTSVSSTGGQQTIVQSIGPRTPYFREDLQIASLSRTPRYPRYDPTYTTHLVTEPSGFGPYVFTAATGLGSGQTAATQRWPNIGATVTYTATIRNSGTVSWSGIAGEWLVDGVVVVTVNQPVTLAPGETTTAALPRTWDGESHAIEFRLTSGDMRPENSARSIDALSVAFLTYIDSSYMENWRENTDSYPQAATDNLIDWLNRHMTRFNAMFAEADSLKRVHFDVLTELDDGAADPASPARINFAIFPFRYYVSDGDSRLPGYYHDAEDIDYGLLHEMGHQLGLIDLYQLDLPASGNQVTPLAYFGAEADLMHGVSRFINRNTAHAMNHWHRVAHGYYGQYLYDMPAQVKLRVLGSAGAPLDGAQITVFQKCERPGLGTLITPQVKASGVTDSNGEWTLPNVPINAALVPETFAGDELRANPFGYVAVVGTNGVLLIRVEHNEQTAYEWLDVLEVNNAYRDGQTAVATFERHTSIASSYQYFPPADMTEQNAASWSSAAEGGEIATFDDFSRVQVGVASLRVETNGGFDTWVRYPADVLAKWNLSRVQSMRLRYFAQNPNGGFQDRSPSIRLGHYNDGYFSYRPTSDLLNQAIGQWVMFDIPIGGNATWERTRTGSVELDEINYIELHADTWGAGFTLWIDGVSYLPNPIVGDLDADGDVDLNDLSAMLSGFGTASGALRGEGDVDGDGDVDLGDLTELLGRFGSVE